MENLSSVGVSATPHPDLQLQPHAEDDQLPEYDTLSLPDLPPISYEEVVDAKANDSFIMEAPPSYVQLFGESRPEEGEQRTRTVRRGGRRAHTRSRKQQTQSQIQRENGTAAGEGLFRKLIRRLVED